MNAPHIQIGALGEEIVAENLKRKGFSIIDRNYRKKWGELDVIAEKAGVVHFVEVKTVSDNVSRETGKESGLRPEENVHPRKLKRLARAIQTYLLEKNFPKETEWQLDVAIVHLDVATKKARLRYLNKVVL